MTKRRSAIVVLMGLGAIAVGIWLAYTNAPLPNQGARDAAAALAIIGAASVGIERVIEMLWTAVGSFLGEWWPLSIVRQQIDKLEADLDPVVGTFYTEATKGLELLNRTGKLTTEELAKAKEELTKQQTALNTQLTQLRNLAPDSQRAHMLAVAARQKIDLVAAKWADLSDDIVLAVNQGQQSVTALSDFVATFKDNPGKRLISIWAGMLLGLGAATFLGLDVFVAVLGPEGAAAAKPAADPWGIVATGLVIGLGAGPTHELVRVLQEVKKARKTANQPAGA